MSSNRYDHRLVSAHRDILLGAGLIAAYAVVVVCTVWPLEHHSLTSRAIDVPVLTLVAGIALMRLLWRSTSEHLLLLFPTTLFVAQVWLASSTDGNAANYSGFFALAIIYVGLTQQRVVVAMAVAIAAPCWLICQELTTVTVTTVARLGTAITFWLLAGLALASRSELNKAHTAELLDRANTDSLTGLASRLFLADQIEREIGGRGGQESTVMVIDLDGFKGVNDMFGHAAGDELLTTVAGWIRASFRPFDGCPGVPLRSPRHSVDDHRSSLARARNTWHADGTPTSRLLIVHEGQELQPDLATRDSVCADAHHDLLGTSAAPLPKPLGIGHLSRRADRFRQTRDGDGPSVGEILAEIVNAQGDDAVRHATAEDSCYGDTHQNVFTAHHIERGEHQRQRALRDRHSCHAVLGKSFEAREAIKYDKVTAVAIQVHEGFTMTHVGVLG